MEANNWNELSQPQKAIFYTQIGNVVFGLIFNLPFGGLGLLALILFVVAESYKQNWLMWICGFYLFFLPFVSAFQCDWLPKTVQIIASTVIAVLMIGSVVWHVILERRKEQ